MPLRLGVVLLGVLMSCPSWASNFSVCPGWDQTSAEGPAKGYWAFASPYTYHWSDENASDHKPVFALSISRQLPNERFCGFSLFRNSFGQPSAYAFTGWYWPSLLTSHPEVYGTVSAGVIYGYVGEFKDKVPLNVGGFAPVVIPTVGYRLTPRLALEVQILGTAAVMFGASWRL